MTSDDAGRGVPGPSLGDETGDGAMAKTTRADEAKIPTVRATGRSARREYTDDRLPVYSGPWPSDDDNRVRLTDGRVCFVFCPVSWGEPPILCTTLVALDAGNNEVRRIDAKDGTSTGLARPVIPRTGVTLTILPAEGTEVGFFERAD